LNENRVGELSNNKLGTLMKIVEYRNQMDITIEFQDEHRVQRNTTYRNFKIGQIKNPYDKSAMGIGYAGEGEHLTIINHKNTLAYRVWSDILLRCYREELRSEHLAYKDCTVCDEWLNFQTFAKWYDDNYYKIDGERMHIDKDILFKGNTIYTPARCLIVPQKINMLFLTKAKTIDPDLPNTIYRCKTGYNANYNGKSLGVYKTVEEAIEAHENAKIERIKQIAEEYKNKIPLKAYEALINYGR